MIESKDETKAPSVLGVSITFTVLATIFTALRLYTRFSLIKNHGLEDYSIALATALSILLTILIGEQVHYGMGRHFDTLSMQEFQRSLKPFWISIWVYYLALTFTKISILIQYYRLLVYRKTQIAIWIASGIVAAYGIVTVFDSIFLCTPVSRFWDKSQSGHCLNETAVWYTNAGLNIIIDIGIVILPMPAVRSLSLPKRQRIGLMALFALGGFVCVVSIVRLSTLYKIATSKDITWDNPPAATWSSVEINIGIVCACLPTLRPLSLSYVPLWWHSKRDRTSSSARQTSTTAAGRTAMAEVQSASHFDTEQPGSRPACFSNPTSGARTMYFGDSQESVAVDADLEALCEDVWTTQKYEKNIRVSVSSTRHE